MNTGCSKSMSTPLKLSLVMFSTGIKYNSRALIVGWSAAFVTTKRKTFTTFTVVQRLHVH
jgi:hypothetical protein